VIAPARAAAFGALMAVTRGRLDLDAALDEARHLLGDARDLALLREIVTGTLRWQARLDWQLEPLVRTTWARLDLEVQVALRMAAFQVLFLDRLPASAVVHDAVALVRQARKSSAAGLVNAVLRRLAGGERRPWPASAPDAPPPVAAAALAVTASHPAWLVERWLARVGRTEAEAWLAFNNTPAAPVLRVNPLAGVTPGDVAAACQADGLTTTPCRHAPLGLVVAGGTLAHAAVVADGRAHPQDEGSQLAALVAPVEAGHRVLDVCAAPGGKALAYAAATGPGGLVVACDVRPRRWRHLADVLDRGRATRARVVGLDPDAPLPFGAAFDVVAVDAPCSGLGTLRRDPDIKWRRTPDDLRRFQHRQIDLLRRAAAAVAPGGALVYTTCSTEPEENEDVIAAWLAESGEFERTPPGTDAARARLAPFLTAEGAFVTRPGRDGLEGYFGVVLRRRPRGRSRGPVVQ
jgi:16S rRNA (cytosine967-C5)-methyltransferase